MTKKISTLHKNHCLSWMIVYGFIYVYLFIKILFLQYWTFQNYVLLCTHCSLNVLINTLIKKQLCVSKKGSTFQYIFLIYCTIMLLSNIKRQGHKIIISNNGTSHYLIFHSLRWVFNAFLLAVKCKIKQFKFILRSRIFWWIADKI